MFGRGISAAIAILILVAGQAAFGQSPRSVDLELVVALDVSTSMDGEERRLQRDGFVAAFRDPEIVDAIRAGPRGCIAVAVMEWGGARRRETVVPWRLVCDRSSAHAIADAIGFRVPGRILSGTAIGEALAYAFALFGTSDYVGSRRVIDLSGDGVSNIGRPLDKVRADLVAQGITINGLPIVGEPGAEDRMEADLPPEILIDYFSNHVIGGPGAFVEPVWTHDRFDEAVRRKLLREISGDIEITRAAPPQGCLAHTTCPTAVRSSGEAWPM